MVQDENATHVDPGLAYKAALGRLKEATEQLVLHEALLQQATIQNTQLRNEVRTLTQKLEELEENVKHQKQSDTLDVDPTQNGHSAQDAEVG